VIHEDLSKLGREPVCRVASFRVRGREVPSHREYSTDRRCGPGRASAARPSGSDAA
jgi:hypothetical protein